MKTLLSTPDNASPSVSRELSLWREVLDALPYPFLVIDASSRQVLLANRLAGSSLLSGITCHELLHHCPNPCQLEGHPCPVEEVVRTGRPAVVLHEHYDPQGQVQHVEVQTYPMFDAQGRVNRVIEYTCDVTVRTATERALRRERDFIDAVLNTTAALVVVLDPEGRIVRCNRACERISGWTFSEIQGRSWCDVFAAPEEAPSTRALLAQLGAGQSVDLQDYACITKNGRRRLIEWSHAPLLDEQGAVAFLIGSGLDRTERRDAERRLRVLNETLEQRVAERTAEAERRADDLRRLAAALAQAERAEQRRLAGVLHDSLQQLLLGVRLGVAAARQQLPDSSAKEQLRQVDATIGEAIEVCRTLAVELASPILRATGLAAALKWLGSQMQERFGLVCTLVADEEADPQDEDVATLVFQSVRELLLNVVKHAQVTTATVTMYCRDDQQLQIVVEDQGVGFDARGGIEPGPVPGTLGLFSVAERLGFLGGRLLVDSAPGRGTRATLTVPVRSPRNRDPE